MVNKIISRRGKRIKYSKRKKFSKYRKHYTRKFVKRFQRRIKRRRQTRNKKGGVFSIRNPPPNEVNDIIYKGYALVTKKGWGPFGTAIGARKDRPEQILIFISTNNSIYILRCVDNESDLFRCGNPDNVEVMGISLDSFSRGRPDQNEFFFKSLKNGEEYRIKLTRKEQEETEDNFKQRVKDFITKVKEERNRVAQDNSGEKVKIKSINMLGKEIHTNANASVVITGQTLDTEYPENIYTLFIDGEGKIKFLLTRDNGFKYNDENDKVIDEMCYRLYTFTDMDDESNSIEIYVQVSPKEGSIFHTLQPYLAADPYFDISNICGDY